MFNTSMTQAKFYNLEKHTDRINNINIQIKNIEANIFLLEKLMQSDYPHVKSKYSKYDMDYLKEPKKTSKSMKVTLKQLKSISKE